MLARVMGSRFVQMRYILSHIERLGVVRNIEDDGEPGWAIRAYPFILFLRGAYDSSDYEAALAAESEK